MPMMEKTVKTIEKDKSILAHVAILACSSQKDAIETKPKKPKGKFCLGCRSCSHPTSKCWTLHLELRPTNVKESHEETKGDRRNGKTKKGKNKSSCKKAKG